MRRRAVEGAGRVPAGHRRAGRLLVAPLLLLLLLPTEAGARVHALQDGGSLVALRAVAAGGRNAKESAAALAELRPRRLHARGRGRRRRGPGPGDGLLLPAHAAVADRTVALGALGAGEAAAALAGARREAGGGLLLLVIDLFGETADVLAEEDLGELREVAVRLLRHQHLCLWQVGDVEEGLQHGHLLVLLLLLREVVHRQQRLGVVHQRQESGERVGLLLAAAHDNAALHAHIRVGAGGDQRREVGCVEAKGQGVCARGLAWPQQWQINAVNALELGELVDDLLGVGVAHERVRVNDDGPAQDVCQDEDVELAQVLVPPLAGHSAHFGGGRGLSHEGGPFLLEGGVCGDASAAVDLARLLQPTRLEEGPRGG
mmetsp:Transcript_13732/g.54343  ORF Transcript_13732/g.54343 Transcript_13732/m.54343 type:complete len:374 (+) Transcript_13732:136-1257(+)